MTYTEQLLRKAAMAAGYKPIRMSDDGRGLLLEGVQEPWNSVDNSGDALDLASDLRICIKFTYCADDAPVVYVGLAHKRRDWPGYEHFPGHRAATRLAITRAAAAIYDSQQEQGE